jgi:hypothetical protein
MTRSLLPLLLVPCLACGGGTGDGGASPPPTSRPFALGFSDFPYARSQQAAQDTYDVLRQDADLVLLQFDDGVPWEEAAAGAPYPPRYASLIQARVAAQPAAHLLYLAVTPIASGRDGLAPRRGNQGSEPLSPPWDARAFDDPAVEEAYLAHCERMLAIFDPDYFAYGIQVNAVRKLAPEKWPALVRLLAAVYPRLKAAHPSLPVFLTFQVDFLVDDPDAQVPAIREVLPYTDLLAASAYPYAAPRVDPTRLPSDYFDRLTALDETKRFAVAETAWPGETVGPPYPTTISANEETQRKYLERLLADADRLDPVFVCWFLSRDYDDLWDSELQYLPNAPALRLGKDTGLYRGDGTPRPALQLWRDSLALPRR